MGFAIIVAIDEAGGIGKDGDLPWQLYADMAHFKNITQGSGNNAVIMGRKTWDSIPDKFRPLPGRLNVVISRQTDLGLPDDTLLANQLDDALAACQDCDEVFVIGGGAIYQQALAHPDCTTCHLTAVHGNFDCDTFFLPDESQWELKSETPQQEENGVRFSFCVYQRKN